MLVTHENYRSPEANQFYMSYSQYTDFQRCEARALAIIRGEYEEEVTTAMLQGGYVDAYVAGTLDQFKDEHPEMFSSRGATKGELKADFRPLDTVIARFMSDAVFTEYLRGDKQVIVTGEISGIPFKGMVDVLHRDRIVDMKCVKDFNRVWSDRHGQYVNFVTAWGYAYQAAIYRELVRQTTGDALPFYITAVTKEKTPDIAVLSFQDQELDVLLEEISYWAEKYQQIKTGEVEPERCGQCDYCKLTRVLAGPVEYHEFLG